MMAPESINDELKPFGQELAELVKEHILTVIDSSRQAYLLYALRNELYWRGKQFLTFKALDGGTGGISLAPVGAPGGKSDENAVSPQKTLSYTFNITRSDGQKFIAVVGQRTPFVNCTPQDANNPESVAAAEDGDATVRFLEDHWDTRSLQKDVARTVWRTGPQFARLVWREDKANGEVEVSDTEIVEKVDPFKLTCTECGFSEEVQAPEMVPCPQCGNPATTIEGGTTYQDAVQTNVRKEPRGLPELEFSTIFETTIPPQIKNLKQAAWLVNEQLTPSARVKQSLGDLVKGIKDESEGGSSVPSQESMGDHYDMIASADLQGQNRKNLWWVTGVWLKPEMFHHAKPQLRKILRRKFKDGVRLTFVNMQYVESAPEVLTDVWFVCKTGTDDRILADPICHDLVPINQIINNFFNLATEIVLRSIPKTIVNSRLIDRKAISSEEANACEVLFTTQGVNEDLSKMMAKLPTSSFSEQMMELAGLFRQYSRELDGALEAIFGGGEAAPTWRQDQQRKNQALAQFYIAYDEMRLFWTSVHKGAQKMLSTLGVGAISIPSDEPFQFEPRVVDFTKLQPELVRVEAEEKMPMTRAEEADELRAQFADPPQVQDMVGLFHPVNVPRIVSMTQIRGMQSPMSDLTTKSLRLIKQLLDESPVPPEVDEFGQPVLDPVTMMPATETPSLTPDPFEFKNATYVVEIFRAFVNSRSGERYASEKPDGFRNVRLFGNALEAMATAQTMQAAPPGGPAAPPPEQTQQPVAA